MKHHALPHSLGQTATVAAVRKPWSLRLRLLAWALALALLGELLLWSWPAASAGWALVLRLGVVLGVALVLWHVLRAPLQALQSAVDNGPSAGAVASVALPPELMPLLQAVQGAMGEQRQAIERQRVFLADASHQLRTPFAVLRAQLQGMQSGELAVADTLPKMLATVDRSSVLVRQILSMAKVEQLVAQAEWQPVNLEDVAREVCLECGPLIARKGLDFSLEAVPVRLHTDAWMLGELLRNLLSNAIHHAPRGSAIGLVVRLLPGQAEIIVWDNGGGINESVRDRLFEPFQSASGASGVGLGLSICRQIAQSMQAQVDLYNRLQDDRVVGVDAVVRWPLDVAEARP
jgi:signal transduction histidine kinase